MSRIRLFALALAVVPLLPAPKVNAAAIGATITLDFNNLPNGANNSNFSTLLTNTIQIVRPGGTVVVTGAKVDPGYDGDNHVTGPGGAAHSLGTSDGGTGHAGLDAYLANNSSGDRIVMTFNFNVYGVSFDYQIFPNADVENGTGKDPNTTSNWPDFTFKSDGVTIFRTLAIMPGSGGSFSQSAFSIAHGQASELAPQFIGQSGFIPLPGDTVLEFIDWPRTVGIDNLVLYTDGPTPQADPPVTPEPASILVFAACLTGLALRQRRPVRV